MHESVTVVQLSISERENSLNYIWFYCKTPAYLHWQPSPRWIWFSRGTYLACTQPCPMARFLSIVPCARDGSLLIFKCLRACILTQVYSGLNGVFDSCQAGGICVMPGKLIQARSSIGLPPPPQNRIGKAEEVKQFRWFADQWDAASTPFHPSSDSRTLGNFIAMWRKLKEGNSF